MKVCFVGLGSIGSRHLRNIDSIFKDKKDELIVHAYRESNRVLNNGIIDTINKQIYNIEDLDNDYDVVFITNPTSMHYESIKKFASRTKNMFIEKPIFDDSKYDLHEVKSLLNKNGVFYVAAPMRYTDVLINMKSIIENKKVYSVRSICSSYLPDWRHNIDYRENYSAHKELGGGVSIDCIHELDYLFYLFGFPEKTYNERGTFSHLEINSDDLSVYIFKYRDKIIELHLDYFGRSKERILEIYTREGMYKGDFYRNQITYPNGDILKFNSNDNDEYVRELNTFFDMIEGRVINENSIEIAINVLKNAEGGI